MLFRILLSLYLITFSASYFYTQNLSNNSNVRDRERKVIKVFNLLPIQLFLDQNYKHIKNYTVTLRFYLIPKQDIVVKSKLK